MGDKTIIHDQFDEEGPLPPGLLLQLTFLAGANQGRIEKLYKKTTVLGRSQGDIILNDTAASSRHAEIVFDGGQFAVRDLNSTNGTILNGGQVWDSVINNGDEITIGNTVIKVEIKQAAASASWADLGMQEQPEAQAPVDDNEITNVALDRNDPLDQPVPQGVKAGLQVVSGLDAGQKLLLTKRGTVIGRAGADLQLHDLDVSRKHASIEFMSPERVILKDLRSRNGTYVNDKWTSVTNLKNGDLIKVGNTEIKVFLSTGQ